MIFEINGDLIRLSQGFRDCQLLARAAESQRSSSLALCLQYLQFGKREFIKDTIAGYL
jgi:hypothetical protein